MASKKKILLIVLFLLSLATISYVAFHNLGGDELQESNESISSNDTLTVPAEPLSLESLPEVLAVVNGEPIVRERFLLEKDISLFMAGIDPVNNSLPLVVLINQSINRELLLQNALNDGFSVNESEAKVRLVNTLEGNGLTLDSFQDEVRSLGISCEDFLPYYANELSINDYLNSSLSSKIIVNDSELNDYYESHKQDFLVPESIRVSHILVGNKSVAENIISKLSKGANFSELALEYSVDPSVNSSGDIGFITRGSTVPAFEEAAFSLSDVGSYTSEPVKLDSGWDVILLTDRRDSYYLPFSSVREYIYSLIYEAHRLEVVSQFVNWIYSQSDVEWLVNL